ncbi:bacteriocin [Streptococcus uberis]|uniref:bacteriocin n=1 Tax=Streptococcus uberis TaxID=1349 RepID=UPI001FF58F7B|nr:bacteriocin [Streptococcus uberis]MCK1168888.1 bacteriocin [Streptococcus uberis]MCK1186636.1 bacteriocin [Streptococcus uberis]
MSKMKQFKVLSEELLKKTLGGTNVAPGIYCVDKNGKAKCSVDYKELWGYTDQVIGNGWINYGPWAPRPGFGVIIP